MTNSALPQEVIQRVVVEHHGPSVGKLLLRWVASLLLLGFVTLAMFVMIGMVLAPLGSGSGSEALAERYHSGEADAKDKIAVIRAHGLIMDGQTEFILSQIRRARKDSQVQAVVLEVDSPGGLVSDSNRIYHHLIELRDGDEEHAPRPVVVSMKSLAASGGYYIAAAGGSEGTIFAEPTTLTGSIGVIFPRYAVTGLLQRWDITVEAIKTGKMKDAGSPFRPLTDEERQYWQHIIDQSFEQFLDVVAAARQNLTRERLHELADGRVYTATEALQHGLIDVIGYLDDAVKEAKRRAGVTEARVVTYSQPSALMSLLFGSARPEHTLIGGIESQWDWQRTLLEICMPRAYYLAGVR